MSQGSGEEMVAWGGLILGIATGIAGLIAWLMARSDKSAERLESLKNHHQSKQDKATENAIAELKNLVRMALEDGKQTRDMVNALRVLIVEHEKENAVRDERMVSQFQAFTSSVEQHFKFRPREIAPDVFRVENTGERVNPTKKKP